MCHATLLNSDLGFSLLLLVFLVTTPGGRYGCALMSCLTSSCLAVAVHSAKVPPEWGCSSGSVPTLGHTSVSSVVERYLISCCLRNLNPASTHTLLGESVRPPSKPHAIKLANSILG